MPSPSSETRTPPATAGEITPLTLPHYADVKFGKNYVKLAACELRFPTNLELEAKPPIVFQKGLKKDYPIFDQARSLDVGPGSVAEGEKRYQFKSRKQDWIVGFRASAVSLEVTKYTTFEDLRDRVKRIIAAAQPVIDSDFFTRVGLRYINTVPVAENKIDGLINTALVAPLAQGVYGTVTKFWQEVRGAAPTGKYSFRHGLPENQATAIPEYVLDIDMYEENVELVAVIDLLTELHAQSYDFFRWALGAKAVTGLGPPLTKSS